MPPALPAMGWQANVCAKQTWGWTSLHRSGHLGAFGGGRGLSRPQHIMLTPYPCQGIAHPGGGSLIHSLLHVTAPMTGLAALLLGTRAVKRGCFFDTDASLLEDPFLLCSG